MEACATNFWASESLAFAQDDLDQDRESPGGSSIRMPIVAQARALDLVVRRCSSGPPLAHVLKGQWSGFGHEQYQQQLYGRGGWEPSCGHSWKMLNKFEHQTLRISTDVGGLGLSEAPQSESDAMSSCGLRDDAGPLKFAM